MGMPSTPVRERLAIGGLHQCREAETRELPGLTGQPSSRSSVLQASKVRKSGSLVIIDSLSLKGNKSVWDVYFLLCEFWFLE